MKKALFVSLLSTVALLSMRAQAQVLCTLGGDDALRIHGGHAGGRRPRKRI